MVPTPWVQQVVSTTVGKDPRGSPQDSTFTTPNNHGQEGKNKEFSMCDTLGARFLVAGEHEETHNF